MSDTTPPPHRLRERALRGGALTLGAQLARLCLRVVSTVILARLLSPQDFGLFAMAIAFTGILAVFRDAGLAQATIQRADLDHAQVSTLFWTNLALGVALLLLGAALAPGVAWLFEDPRLLPLTIACAGVFLLSAPGVQHLALLRREMRFAAIVRIEFAGAATSVAVAVLAAWNGAGYWALVLGQWAGAAVGTAGCWRACRFRPARVLDLAGARPLLAFGVDLTLYSLCAAFARQFDNILIGWQAGAHALGLYSRAYQLLLFPMQQAVTPMSAVALPTLSRLQHDPPAYRRYYLRLVSIVAHVTMPGVALLFGLAEPLVLLLLGPAWAPVVGLFSVLAVAAFIQPVVATLGVVYQSSGRTRRLRNWGLMAAGAQCLAFLAGLPWGAMGVAVAYSAVNVALALPALAYAFAGTGLSVRAVLRGLWRPMLASVLLAALTRAVLARGEAATPLAGLALGLAVAGLLAVVLLAAWPRLREGIVSVLRLAVDALRPQWGTG